MSYGAFLHNLFFMVRDDNHLYFLKSVVTVERGE
jgi:hypothetical protein